MRASEFLVELKKISSSDEIEGKNFILTSSGYVIIFDEGDDIELPDDIIYEYADITDMIDDLQSYTELGDDAKNKYLVGQIANNYAEIYYTDSELMPTQVLNSNLKKLVKELELSGIRYQYYNVDMDDEEEVVLKAENILKAKLSNVKVYHGTNYKYLDKILKLGLRPTENSNFEKISHENKIFFTTKMEYAKWHSSNSASKNNSFPVILEMKIPDSSKVVLDYDVAIQQYGVNHPLTVALGYQTIFYSSGGKYGKELNYQADDVPQMLSDKNSLNTKYGIFGYEGRIPPTHILRIFIDPYALVHYEEYGEIPEVMNPQWHTEKEFKKAYKDAVQDMIDSFDEDF